MITTSQRKKIGIIDSGIGGLSLIRQLINYDIDIYYFADTKNMPYGDKSSAELLVLSMHMVDTIEYHGITEIIIGCFTLCATVYAQLVTLYPHIHFIEIISPVVSQSIALTQNNRILVLSTPATVISGIFRKKFEKYSHITIIEKACPTLAKIIENNHFNDLLIQNTIDSIYKEICLITPHPNVIILGCTHYTFIETTFSDHFNKKISFVYAQIPSNILEKQNAGQSNVYYFVSGNQNSFHQKLHKILPKCFTYNLPIITI